MVLLALRELELSFIDLIPGCVLTFLGVVQVSLLHADDVGVSFSEMIRVEVVRCGRIIINQGERIGLLVLAMPSLIRGLRSRVTPASVSLSSGPSIGTLRPDVITAGSIGSVGLPSCRLVLSLNEIIAAEGRQVVIDDALEMRFLLLNLIVLTVGGKSLRQRHV